MTTQMKEYDRKEQKIHKCIFNIYEEMENNINEKKAPFSHIPFLEQLETHDKDKIRNILKNIYNQYEEYLYAILFEDSNLNTPDSGDCRTLKDFKQDYQIDKIYNCTSTDTLLFKILYKYEDIISNNQSINQNNLLSIP